jgi:hypothetical protein
MRHCETSVRAWFASLVLLGVLGASPARAQVYVVDPYGSEGFADLQTALDTVPAGSTLLVKGDGGGMCPWLVTKSVTILGLNITAGGVTASGSSPIVLTIDAGADSVVTLKDVKIDGGWCWGPSYQALDVTSVGELVVRDSELRGGRGLAGTCEYYFRNGDALHIASARSVAIIGSIVAGGGPGDTLWSESGCPDPHQADGGYAIASGADVLLIEDSTVTGGGGSDVGYYCGYDGSDAPYEPIGSDGGFAVSAAGVTWLSNATITGGAAGNGVTMGCVSDLGQPGNPGGDIGAHGDLPDVLSVTDALLGKPITLAGVGFEPTGAALIFLSTSLGPPIAIRQGFWFLDAPFLYMGAVPTDAAGGFTLTANFPNEPALIGTTLVVQATDLVRLSEPTILVPRRNKP